MTNLGHPAQRVRKLMLYSHDTYGLGHLRRNLRIASHLLRAAAGLRIVLATGSPVASYFPLPPGLTIVKLPSVRKVGAGEYQPLDSRVGIGLIRRTRTAVMRDVVRRFHPDVLLVDHSPAGMNGELLGVFDAVRDHSPGTRVVLGLRDILDDPAAVIRAWTEQGIYQVIEEAYGQVVVYGCQDVFDVGDSYGLPGRVRDRLVYCGYLEPAATGEPPAGDAGIRYPRPYLLATAGGGGDGVVALTGAIEAGRVLGLRTIAVTGPLIGDRESETLAAVAARAGGVELVRFHPHLQSAMAAAAAVVTMGGYNSLCEAVAAAVPTVVVPRHHPRLEQAIRARLFAERGLVRVAEPGPGLGRRIARAVTAGAAPALQPIDFRGLDRLAHVLLGEPRGRGAGVFRHPAPRRATGEELADRRPA
jgi:predicted glycosyltransferase